MFLMTYNEAILIQRAQMYYYRQRVGLSGIRAIKKATLPCPDNVHPDEPIKVSTINGLVPRGGSFERHIVWRTCEIDPTSHALHDAIRKGLL